MTTNAKKWHTGKGELRVLLMNALRILVKKINIKTFKSTTSILQFKKLLPSKLTCQVKKKYINKPLCSYRSWV